MNEFRRQERALHLARQALADKINAAFPEGTEVVVDVGAGRKMRGTVAGPTTSADVHVRTLASGRVKHKHYTRVWKHIDTD